MKARSKLLMALLLAAAHAGLGQNGGKIVGRVTDASTGERLIGAHVIIEGTRLGAATDADGEYAVLKVPSGVYTLTASIIGYTRTMTRDVQVLSDLTTTIDFKLANEAIALKEVVTVAQAPMVRKDLTATESRVTAEQINVLPIQSFDELLTLQAGVSKDAGGGIHIRGGRSSEISYLVNGISVTDDYNRTQTITVDPEAIQELQVISGTFNAEYGNAMSGVVNVVTKAGGSALQGTLEAWTGDYVSSHKGIFWGIDRISPVSLYNFQASLSGPLAGEDLTFFAALRRSYDDGWLYGINRYSPQGRNFPGDNSFVSMSSSSRWSGQASVQWQPTGYLKVKLDALGNIQTGRFYSQLYRLNPNGLQGQKLRGGTGMATITYQFSPSTFQELTVAYKQSESLSRLYDDPFDPRYVHPDSLNVPGYHFLTAGTSLGRFQRTTKTVIGKLDITSQVDKYNLAKAGIEVQFDDLWYENITLVPARNSLGQQIVPFVQFIEDIDAPTHDRFTRKPMRFAAFVQDKIELESMIINLGLRFEMFDPKGNIPSDESDPNIFHPFKLIHLYHDVNHDGEIGSEEQTGANTLSVAERQTFWYKKARKKLQLSPRLGIAYPITDRGIIRFSLGMFQQIPEYSQLYQGDQFKLTSAQGLQGPFGNNDLKPQRTTIYELGLQQQITENLAADVTGFYRDIREWVTTTPPIPTFQAGTSYSKRTNRDFANVRGMTFSLKKRLSSGYGFTIDYTFQIADGTNSSSDQEFFSRLNGSEPTKILTPLDWDQEHTLNTTLYVGGEQWGASLISTVSTGQPYTPSRIGGAYTGRNVVTGLANNSRRKPVLARFDLEVKKDFEISPVKLEVYFRVLNLFDARNPITVWSDTGEPDFTIQKQEVSNYDPGWFDDPTFYSEPRSIVVGTRISL